MAEPRPVSDTSIPFADPKDAATYVALGKAFRLVADTIETTPKGKARTDLHDAAMFILDARILLRRTANMKKGA